MNEVQIIKTEKVKSSHGEYWYRFHGTLNGQRIADSVDIPAQDVESFGMERATATAKRQLKSVAQYMEEQHAAS